MRKPSWKSFPTVLLGAVALVTLACASSGSPAPAAPTGPVELNGTLWKMLSSRGKIDQRTIRFKKEGNAYAGYLEDFGLQLRDVPGIRKGMRFFVLEPTGKENEYTGNYEAPGPDGTPVSRAVNVTVSGNTLTWNLESVTWERVE